MSARTAMLARIRAALADVPAAETPDDVEVPRTYRRDHHGDDPVGLFAERAADYRATVTVVPETEAASAVADRLRRRHVDRLVVPPGFPEALLSPGPWKRLDDEPLADADLDGADAVLTTSAVAIAETGTVVLDAGPGQGRRVLTLLPDYHLCLVRADRIVSGVPEALELLDPRRPLTFVSGPSATSDIELDRVEGVHGPRTLDILIITHAERPETRP